MEEFVDLHRQEILTKALGDVSTLLVDTCSTFEGQMKQHADGFLVKVKEDYQTAMLGREMVLSGTAVSPALRAVQEKVYKLLLKLDDDFAVVVHKDSTGKLASDLRNCHE